MFLFGKHIALDMEDNNTCVLFIFKRSSYFQIYAKKSSMINFECYIRQG